MRFSLEPPDADALELERQKRSQRRINGLLLVLDILLLGFVIYEIIAKISSI